MSSSQQTDLVLGTAGHIDHGKSSLVKALTGTDPDRLAAEKERGITIELGFAQLEFDDGTTMGVVDVPGHERFVRQMIAGSSGIDVALLCIAADDGIMPQTIEHIAVLSLLSIPACVVALTKVDLVDDDWAALVSEEVHTYLAETPFADAPIIPTSSKSGKGLDDLKAAILKAARSTRRAKTGDAVRMPVDRVFTIKGSGTVATGTLWSGTVALEDELEVLPGLEKGRVRSIHRHNEPLEMALPGNRIALNLHGLGKDDLKPGDFLATPGTIVPTDRFDAFFTYIDTAKRGKPLKSGSRVHVAHGTKEIIGRILFMGEVDSLSPQESAYAQFRLDEALPVSWRDAFVVRSYSPVHVIGGGTVLQSHPRRRTTLQKNEAALLDSLYRNDGEEAVRNAFGFSTEPVTASGLAYAYGLPYETVQKELDGLCQAGKATRLTGANESYYLQPSMLQKQLASLENTLLRFHTENPTKTGISKADLKKQCAKNMDDACFDAVLEKAREDETIISIDGLFSHPKAGAGAKAAEEALAKKLYALVVEAGTAPPTIPELITLAQADGSLVHRALGSLEKQGKTQRISTDLCFSKESLASLEEAVVDYLKKNGEASVAELKEAMGTSRKYAVPLLEYFDNQGLTKRFEDKRRLS